MNTIDTSDLISKMQQMMDAAKIEPNATTKGESGNFSSIIGGMINAVNSAQENSAELKKSYELGDTNVSLTEVMIASKKSELSFQALLQVRNKLLSAYQDVMRMQI